MTAKVRLLVVGIAGALASCGHSAPTVLHGLSAVPPLGTAPAYAGRPVTLDAVRLPPALDRVEVLRETAPGRYTVQEFDRWAAPPARLARQALAEDLALRLPPSVVVTSEPSGGPPVMAVSVDVLAFSAGPASATLAAGWTRGCRPGGELARLQVRLAGAAGEPPQALAQLLARLADAIATDLRVAPDAACPPPPPEPPRNGMKDHR